MYSGSRVAKQLKNSEQEQERSPTGDVSRKARTPLGPNKTPLCPTTAWLDLVTFKYVRPIWYGPLLPQPDKPCKTGNLDQIKITFTGQGKQDTQWSSGLCWSVIYYKYGGHVSSILIVQLKIEPVKPTIIGPNKALDSDPTPPPTERPMIGSTNKNQGMKG